MGGLDGGNPELPCLGHDFFREAVQRRLRGALARSIRLMREVVSKLGPLFADEAQGRSTSAVDRCCRKKDFAGSSAQD